MYGQSVVGVIEEFYFERWATNPFHYGSFSTWPVGADSPVDAMERLQGAVGRLHFAQDATDVAIGTVSGSVTAGEREARKIIACMSGRGGPTCNKQYQPCA